MKLVNVDMLLTKLGSDLSKHLTSSQNRYKVDSEDGLDDTLFDCTQISSESEFEVMKPEKSTVITNKPSFQEIR